MASSTRSASSVNSVPGIGSNFGGGPTRTACSCFTLPCSSPVKRLVVTLQSRDAAFFVRRFRCAAAAARAARESWATRSGRLRHHLELMDRRRLLPVRRAQAIGAGIAAADDHHALARGQNLVGDRRRRRRALFCCGRNSMAKWMPFSSRPGTARSRGLFGAAGQQRWHRIPCAGRPPGTFTPTWALGLEDHAFLLHLVERAGRRPASPA